MSLAAAVEASMGVTRARTNATIDWENGGAATIPVAFQVGYVTRIGRFHYNFSVEPFKLVAHQGPSADWGVRFGFVMLVPEP